MKPLAANPSSSAVILEGTGSVFQLPELVTDADSRPLCTFSSNSSHAQQSVATFSQFWTTLLSKMKRDLCQARNTLVDSIVC